MGLIKILVSFGMIILFTVAILSFVIDLSDDESLSSLKTNLEGSSNTLIIKANESKTFLQEAKIKTGDENVEEGGQFKSNPYSMFELIKGIFVVGNDKIFGGGSFTIATTILGVLLSIIIGLYIWKTWKGGSPD